MEEFVVGDPNKIKNVGMNMNGILSKYLFEHVIDFDLTSLYPSIILAFNVDCTTQYGLLSFNEKSEFHEIIPINDFIDDLITQDFISIGKKYYNLPNISDAIEELDTIA